MTTLYAPSAQAEIANEKSARKRKALIASLAESSPSLLQEWRDHVRLHETERFFFSSSGAYPNGGSGRLNYYKLFLEGAWHSTSQTGRLGMVIPSGLTTNAYERPLWHSFVKARHVSTVLDFENKYGLFPSVDTRAKFSVFVVAKKAEAAFLTGCWLRSVEEIRNPERVMTLTLEDLTQFSPEELALPQFRTKRDLNLLRHALDKHGILSAHDDWEYTPRLMFSSSDTVFQPIDQATVESSKLTPLNRRTTQNGVTLVPVYEGKMVGILDHRQADIHINPNNPARPAQERPIRTREKKDPSRFAVPQFWLHEDAVRQRRFSKVQKDWELVFCDVTSATNERTALACIIPLSGLTRNLPAIYLATASAKDAALLAAVLSSFVLDFFARLKVSSNHLTQGILATLPIPSRDVIRLFALKSFGDAEWFEKRSLELCYTAWDLEPFAQACGYHGPPFAWDERRRAKVQAELDAACFHLYGLARDEVEYVMDSFSSVARREIDECDQEASQ